MVVTTTDAKLPLATGLDSLIEPCQEIVRERLRDIETQATREKLAVANAEAILAAAEQGASQSTATDLEPDRYSRGRENRQPINYNTQSDPSGVWFWWEEECWGELLHALCKFALEGQAAVLEILLRSVLPKPQAVIARTLIEQREVEVHALREILSLFEQWLPEAAKEGASKAADQALSPNTEAALVTTQGFGEDPDRSSKTEHSTDFRSVCWYGQDYSFTEKQALCVEALWNAWLSGVPELGGKTLLNEADANTERLDMLFRDHPAWRTMIISGTTKGTYRLSEPATRPSMRSKGAGNKKPRARK